MTRSFEIEVEWQVAPLLRLPSRFGKDWTMRLHGRLLKNPRNLLLEFNDSASIL